MHQFRDTVRILLHAPHVELVFSIAAFGGRKLLDDSVPILGHDI